MTIVIGLLMAVAAAAYVAAPFFTGGPAEPGGPVTGSERQKRERQKVEAYAAIKELEFDYRMGKLSEADFTFIRNKYAAEALEAIKVLETAKPPQPRELPGARRSRRIAFCPTCGRRLAPQMNFCPGCGRAVKEEAVA